MFINPKELKRLINSDLQEIKVCPFCENALSPFELVNHRCIICGQKIKDI
jgi:methionyl-tRNA synthetase